MNRVFLLIGSNMGNRENNFASAKMLIAEHCGVIVQSSALYETAAWGKNDQPAFLNQALEIETDLDAEQLMIQILRIEKMMGRERKEKYGPRQIDIDILLFNREQYDKPHLKIPHPEMQNRRFALTPLAEIAPDVEHPVLKKSITRLLNECPDKLDVKKI
ncbi:MAG TPA: 2-amino-4-hydroxy-6-hydroxymethyldihydropteridine diphosphokinase [Chitinophagaceae bacterium]|nr:2-amino-4-hydroxy-6-hydroxymethyldihydropteridine diphosphokinase [Chitinophagaceae bacterium]